MALQASAYAVPLVLSAVFGFVVAWLLWRERPRDGATWLSLTAGALAVWAGGQAIVVSGVDPGLTLLGAHVTIVGAAFIPGLVALFALAYVRRTDVPWPVVGLALAPAAGLTALALVGHEFVAPWVSFVAWPGQAPPLPGRTPVVVASLYVNGALLAGEYLLFRLFWTSRNVYRKRSFLLLVMIGSMHACHLVSAFGLSPTPSFTLTPLVFLVFGALSVAAIVGSRSLSFLPLQWLLAPFSRYSMNLAPLARNHAIEEMGTGFLVVDYRGRIVDANPAGREVLGRGDDRVVGKELTAVARPEWFVADPPAFVTCDPGEVVDGRFGAVWIERPDGERRCYDVVVSTLATDGEAHGYVVLVHDVTERERRKQTLEERTRELERQNERLEDFAGVVSHDLRNPLSVASGRLQLVEAGEDQSHVEAAVDALDRMGAIIDDVLAFAHLGTTVDDAEPVELAAVARDAWDNVATRDATLSIETDVTVEASRSRLLQVFENLFRNAVEHAGPEVTVTVGQLPDGFYVADDGPGIPEGRRDSVLEEGFSTEADGTGFGLSIVRTIVEAHGWEIAVDESEAGGARFEITGVGSPAQAFLWTE